MQKPRSSAVDTWREIVYIDASERPKLGGLTAFTCTRCSGWLAELIGACEALPSSAYLSQLEHYVFCSYFVFPVTNPVSRSTGRRAMASVHAQIEFES